MQSGRFMSPKSQSGRIQQIQTYLFPQTDRMPFLTLVNMIKHGVCFDQLMIWFPYFWIYGIFQLFSVLFFQLQLY